MLQRTRLNPLRHNSSAETGFLGDGPNWLADCVEGLDTIEYRFTRIAARLPGNMVAFSEEGARRERPAHRLTSLICVS